MFGFYKLFDEGTESPFIKRLYANILWFRDVCLPQNKHHEFDKLYMNVFNPLYDCRRCVLETYSLLCQYADKVNKGQIIQAFPKSFSVNETIDEELRNLFNHFVNNGLRAYKNIQKLTSAYELDIGPLYQQDKNFDNYVCHLNEKDMHDFAKYVDEVRKDWGGNFQNLRNMMEHEGWQLDKISFEFINKSFEAKLPQVYDVDFFEYMKHIVCRLSDFVENIVLFIFQKDNAYPMFQINGNPWTISFNKEYDETWLLKV